MKRISLLVLAVLIGTSALQFLSANQMTAVLCVLAQVFFCAYFKTGQLRFRHSAIVLNLLLVLTLVEYELKPRDIGTPDVAFVPGGMLRASAAFAEEQSAKVIKAEAQGQEAFQQTLDDLESKVNAVRRRVENSRKHRR